MAAARDERFRGGGVGFLSEADHPMESVARASERDRFRDLEISVSGLRPTRSHPERDHGAALRRRRHRRLERGAERVFVLHPVIGVERDDDVGSFGGGQAGHAPADRRRRVPPHRLEQDLLGRRARAAPGAPPRRAPAWCRPRRQPAIPAAPAGRRSGAAGCDRRPTEGAAWGASGATPARSASRYHRRGLAPATAVASRFSSPDRSSVSRARRAVLRRRSPRRCPRTAPRRRGSGR